VIREKMQFMKAPLYSTLVSAVLTGLFGYTALSKLLEYDRFRAVLSASPLIATGAGALAAAIPVVELAVVLLLILPRTRLAGLVLSFALLVLFTSYLGYMVLYAPHLPCSCGGVISALGWRAHLLLNGVLLLLTALALRAEALREGWLRFGSPPPG
jgi:hypothetical protein